MRAFLLAMLFVVLGALLGCHAHCWKEVGRTFTPPASGYLPSFAHDLSPSQTQGFTTIEYHCEKCDAVKFTRIEGKAELKEEATP